MFEKRFKNRLKLQQKRGLYRKPPVIDSRDGKYLLVGGKRVVNFASNDYLGLGTSKKFKQKVAENFKKFSSSSSASRLVSGNYSVIAQAEKTYAKYFGYETALFFPSGFQANIGLVSTLFEKGDTLFFDKHIHASSVKGIALSGAEFCGYNHNSMAHLEKRLDANKKKHVAVLAESLFSMDGDFLDVAGLKKLKEKHRFLCIVDEAHAFGVIDGHSNKNQGHGMAGTVADIAVGTFGKALGLFGAFVLLPGEVREYLFNFSSPLIYSTTLPEAHAASAIDLLEIISENREKREHLRNISLFMKNKLVKNGFDVEGDAHILAVLIGDEQKCVNISNALFEKGFFSFPARYPTVPSGRAILRLGMTALHTETDVMNFVDALCEYV